MYMPPNVRIVVVERSLPRRPFAKTLIADRRDGDRERELRASGTDLPVATNLQLLHLSRQLYQAFFFHFFTGIIPE